MCVCVCVCVWGGGGGVLSKIEVYTESKNAGGEGGSGGGGGGGGGGDGGEQYPLTNVGLREMINIWFVYWHS